MRHTKRRFNPNIQKTTVWVDGQRRRLRVCAKCLKTLSHKLATGEIRL